MAFIVWKDSYNLGIEVIDQQHLKLAWIINDVYDSIGKNHEGSSLKWAFRELFEYVDYHFLTEEKFLFKASEAEYEKHKKSHDKFREKLREMWNGFQMGFLARDLELMQELKRWFVGHTQGFDRQYIPLYRANPELLESVAADRSTSAAGV